MAADCVHNHPEFPDLIRIVAEQKGIAPALVEKDYWIMHCLYGLQQLGFKLELKGGTSLSKGHGIIHRFSEDIDIHIEPPPELHVKTGRNQTKHPHVESRRKFYEWLVKTIEINGIEKVARDTAFDGTHLFSGGIRLFYRSITPTVDDLREGVLLEAGFDTVTPNTPKDISSWAYDYAAVKIDIIDNRAKAVSCYDPRYTFVEKLQTVSTKFRKQQEKKGSSIDFMRHYHDVYSLLQRPEVQAFIGTDAYKEHKDKRFPRADERDLSKNQAFHLTDLVTRAAYETAYNATSALYYVGKPTLEEILGAIGKWADRM